MTNQLVMVWAYVDTSKEVGDANHLNAPQRLKFPAGKYFSGKCGNDRSAIKAPTSAWAF